MTLFGGDVGSSESLFVFLFFPEAVPEVSLGAEAADPKERDRCFGGIFADLLLLCVLLNFGGSGAA